MQFVVEFIAWLIIDCVLWGVGAGIKKILGQPLSASGASEEWIGICTLVVLGVAAFFAFS